MSQDSNDLTLGGLRTPSRRRMLQGVSAGAALAGVMAASGLTAKAARAAGSGPSTTDLEVLNFALNLEYLEAEFYLRATTGAGLQPSETSGLNNSGAQSAGGPVTGGGAVPFHTPRVKLMAQDIATDEHQHVLFLRSALTSTYAVAEPQIDFATSFTTLARAAGIVGPTGSFNPFADEESFLLGAYVFEDVGVTAYHGAAPLLIDNTTYLSAAAGILAVEAYHAGAVRTQIQLRDNALIDDARKVSALRSKLSGEPANMPDDMGPVQNGHFVIAPTDSNSIAFSRTTSQVLNVVYGGGAAGKGGLFFPAGMNGAIR